METSYMNHVEMRSKNVDMAAYRSAGCKVY
jgi:hypothetical protein